MRFAYLTSSLVAISFLVGCANTAPQTVSETQKLQDHAQAALNRMTSEDPSLQSMLDNSRGYAIYPGVGKGGAIVGGAYGKGVVYEQGRQVGFTDLTQASIGAQLGGQKFAELIVFKDQAALDRFRAEKLEFAANATAVAAKAGAGEAAKFTEGVAIFVKPEAGLMAEASVGGQKFTYQTNDQAAAAQTAASKQ